MGNSSSNKFLSENDKNHPNYHFLRSFIKAMGFGLKENSLGVYEKKHPNHNNYTLEVDFENKRFNYGSLITFDNGIVLNFNPLENWIVFECVNRLLEKGYLPSSIVLEKNWPTGHGTSARVDVLVKRKDNSSYMMIECKRCSGAFVKAYKRLLKDGGQLLTYFQQDKNADILMLYSSALEGDKIKYRNQIIKIQEEYRQTFNVKELYNRWNKLPKKNGIFEDWVKPYDFKSKALTPNRLKKISHTDSNFIFNSFLEILRHHVVSDKPNAFNKIFNLFLCKIYDEKHTLDSQELSFQWKEEDDNEKFQSRLSDLYREGMKEFLEKDICDFSYHDFKKNLARYIDDEEGKKIMLKRFTNLRLKKNNEFAIKEVFDESSFSENAKVIKEVVELLQSYRIRYDKHHQYLSDFFELLLNTGLKQESGQFFTPIPLTQFILKSLPMENTIKEKLNRANSNNILPFIIDYAAGSGHFLTQAMEEIHQIIMNMNLKDYEGDVLKKLKAWRTDHFSWASDYVYGIEKDYRLVKVSKVGCHLHGDGLAKLIHGDGLGNFTQSKDYQGKLKLRNPDYISDNNQFDILISNPPYSVSAFKGTLCDVEEDFGLYKELSDKSNEIECLFIERAKQLLKEDALAAIITPVSLLSNSGIYTKTREILLEYFHIISIVELGANAFMATGTHTVVLFLKRRDNQEREIIKIGVDKLISLGHDVTLNGIERPLTKYIEFIWKGASLKDYMSLLQGKPNENIKKHELYQTYQKNTKGKDEHLRLDNIKKIEKDKLFYFILSFAQRLVIIKSGAAEKEKSFLGYVFSQRRGNEGIHAFEKDKSIEASTKMFDPKNNDNPEKANSYIRKAYMGNTTEKIHPKMQEHIRYENLVDMIDFESVNFQKSIVLGIKNNREAKNQWHAALKETLGQFKEEKQWISIGEICSIKKGTPITKNLVKKGAIPVIAGGKKPAYFHEKSNREGNIITVSASGNAGFVNYFSTPIFASDCFTIKSSDETRVKTKIVYHFLKLMQEKIYNLQKGQVQTHVYTQDLAQIKIPLLSIKTQEEILEKIEKMESKIRSFEERIKQIPEQQTLLFKDYL